MSKLVEFRAFTEFGKGDVTDWEFDYELTDDEYALLKEKYDESADIHDIEELEPLVEKVRQAAIEQATEDFMENEYDMIEEYIQEAIDNGEIDSEEEWTADMVYSIWIDWPYGL